MNTWGHSRASLSPPRDCVSMRGKKARGSERRLTLTLFYLELLLGMKECQESTTAVCWELMCWRRRRSNFQWEASRVCVISLLCLNGGKCWKGVIHHRPISGCNQWWTQDVWGHGAKQNKKKGHHMYAGGHQCAEKLCYIYDEERALVSSAGRAPSGAIHHVLSTAGAFKRLLVLCFFQTWGTRGVSQSEDFDCIHSNSIINLTYT